jgi:hypothetical protein
MSESVDYKEKYPRWSWSDSDIENFLSNCFGGSFTFYRTRTPESLGNFQRLTLNKSGNFLGRK